jgi:glycosyltransferase involved in cell wall biosynthesis
VISSIISAGKKHYFFSDRSFPLRAIVGFEQMQADTLALRAQGTPVFDLCYESLVENPETWLKSICAFLEVPFDPGMLELDRADSSMFPPGEHHAKVKSGHLSRSDRSSGALADSLRQKIARYFQRWKTLFRDQLESRRYWEQTGEREPGRLEVLQDRIKYQAARFFSEQFTPFIYGFFPLRALQRYRAWRGKTFAPSSSSNMGVPRETHEGPSKISVITPSYKQLPWLKLCIASVADQRGVTVEHIVQDAQSGPELEEWVRTRSKAQLYVECDTGMYDAINRGFARATGDIVCWLNSDEQYLKGSLAKVARFFETHPDIDVLFGDALLVDNKGDLLAYRRTIAPILGHIRTSHLNVLSCATFVRRSVLERGFNLNIRWKAIADAVWIAELMQAGIPMMVLNEPLSIFTITDKNLGQTNLAFSESKLWQEETSSRSFLLRAYFVSCHRIMKLLGGAYLPRSISIDIYTLSSPEKRVNRVARRIGFRWPHLKQT